MDVKSRNGEKFEILSKFFAHHVEMPWPISTVLHHNVYICCVSVHVLLRCRSKTAKMQKFLIDSHSNENFICLFFCLPGMSFKHCTITYKVTCCMIAGHILEVFFTSAPLLNHALLLD